MLWHGTALVFCATNAHACVRSRRDSASNLQVITLSRPDTLLESSVARIVFHEACVAVQKVVPRMGLTAHANYSAAAQALSVRPLPQRCNHLQPLRPWSALLQRGLRAPGQKLRPACCRQALPGQPQRSSCPCPAPGAMEGAPTHSDASDKIRCKFTTRVTC